MLKELAWVDYLKKKAAKSKEIIVGIGDDCALVRLGKTRVLLKSDLFIEGIHFKRKEMSYKAIGMRAVARVLSDFAACGGGRPKFIGVSAGIPHRLGKRAFKGILSGILSYGRKYGFSLVGGDTSSSEMIFLDIWGIADIERCVLRSGANLGDYIFITGPLGKRSLKAPFEPRIREARMLVKNFKINSMIDISDGFIIDLYRILKASKKGATLFKDDLPLTGDEADLYRGEDYELIFTVDKSEKNIKTLKNKFYLVGRVDTRKQGYIMQSGRKRSKVKIKGYSHF